MSTYFVQGSTMDAIADAINAKTGGSSAMTPAQMVTAIGTISGGTTITDGIVIKAKNENGYPTEIDFYGDTVETFMFGQGSNNVVGWMYVTKINYMTNCTTIKDSAFQNGGKNGNAAPIPNTLVNLRKNAFSSSQFKSITLPVTVTGRLEDNMATAATFLEEFYAPGITSLATTGGSGNGQFYGCTALKTVVIGSVGYGLTNVPTWSFRNCTQSSLTITIYTTGSYADTAVSNIRNSATNATIIIKASEATTYNGSSYAAGDTIITSEVAP